MRLSNFNFFVIIDTWTALIVTDAIRHFKLDSLVVSINKTQFPLPMSFILMDTTIYSMLCAVWKTPQRQFFTLTGDALHYTWRCDH